MSFLSGFRLFPSVKCGSPNDDRAHEEGRQKEATMNYDEADDNDVDLSCNPNDVDLSYNPNDTTDSSPPVRSDSLEEDDKATELPPGTNLKAENRRLLNIIDANERLIQYLRDEAQSTEIASDNLARENDKLREQVATLSASLAIAKSNTPFSPGTHSSNTTSSHIDDNSGRSGRESTPAPPSTQPSLPSRPLPTPNQRRKSLPEKHQSVASLRKALASARSDIAHRKTRVRQLEFAYEEKKRNDLQRQAKQDWALDKVEKECEGLRREVRTLKRELAERIARDESGGSEKRSEVQRESVNGSFFSSFDDCQERGSLLASPLLKRRRIRDPHDDADGREKMGCGVGLSGTALLQSSPMNRIEVEDKLVSTEEALTAAKKEITNKNWKIWRLEQQVEDLEMIGFRNDRVMYEQKKTIQALEKKFREGESCGSMVDSSPDVDVKVEEGYLYDLLGEAITATKDEVDERRIRSV